MKLALYKYAIIIIIVIIDIIVIICTIKDFVNCLQQ